jgi:7,8-dihydro-6-hydroxymethylpterin dimethyltransferase
MARLPQRDYTYFTTVRGMCRTCRKITPSRIFFRDGGVWQESLCETCENTPAMIASDTEWYLRHVLQGRTDRSPLAGASEPVRGCPHDCGPCSWHATNCQLPVLSITNACNLNCPLCFTYNRPDQIYNMPVDEMMRTVDWIVESSGPVDLINITGGEPTLHPQLLEILKCCDRDEIGRVTMNSNGVRLAADKELCDQLAQLGVCVILSFNTLDSETSVKLHGADLVDIKLKAIENLTRAGVRMTLLNVMVRDTNEDAISGIFELMRQNDQILSLTVQTMTYTGQGGGQWGDRKHLPVDEATRIVCEQSGGMLDPSDFMPRPSTHPLCYSLCYMIKSDDAFLPFLRFAAPEKIAPLLGDSYLIRLGDDDSFFREAIDGLYARGETENLAVFRKLVEDLYPADRVLSDFQRQARAESAIRTVYIHSHMDEDTFDSGRAMLCGDLVPAEPGKLIPACTYNLFYRQQDERFYVQASSETEGR